MTTLPRLPSNATAQEIYHSVRHYYPNLGPLLSQMLTRFGEYDEEYITDLEDQVDSLRKRILELEMRLNNPDDVPDNLCCPHCGSKF